MGLLSVRILVIVIVVVDVRVWVVRLVVVALVVVVGRVLLVGPGGAAVGSSGGLGVEVVAVGPSGWR